MTNIAHPRLSGLGRNPAAPEDVLVRLAAHPAGRPGITRRSGRLPDAVVEALITHGDGRTAIGLRGDRISPAMRRRIAEHPDPAIRDAYGDFIRYSVEVGVATDIKDLEEAYGQSRTALAGASDPKVRAAVAETWPDRPPEVQERLLTDAAAEVRDAATRREQPGVPPEWRDRCLADPATRSNVAYYVPLTPDQFARLLETGDEEAVARNPHLTAGMVAQLLDIDDPAVRLLVAQSRHLDAETRDRLYSLVEAQRAAGDLVAEVALGSVFAEPEWLRDAPLDERLTYLDRADPVFRLVLASCPDLPEAAWHRLDNDPVLAVRRAAAQRAGAPPRILERLVREHGEVFHVHPLLVEHPNFPRQALRTFVDEPDPRVRFVALQDPELPVPALRRLAADSESFLRRGVAGHPGVTDALLDQLLADPEPGVADEAAANPRLRPAAMYRILTDADL